MSNTCSILRYQSLPPTAWYHWSGWRHRSASWLDGTPVPASPPLPRPDGTIEDCHDAAITEDTIIPPWYGERLDLDHAIYICLANARAEQERRDQRDQAGEPVARAGDQHRVQVFEPQGWADRIRRYYDEHATRPRGPVLVPIPV